MLSADSTLLAVRRIISGVLAVEMAQINYESQMGSVPNWDSLNNLRIFLEIENCFNLKFDIIDVMNVRSVGDWVEIIEKYTGQQFST